MEYEELMKKLVKITARSFYADHHCVILDILLEKVVLYDTEISERMKMLAKEFNKLVVKLKEDKLIKHETKIETKVDGRQIHRSVYYMDFSEVRNVIKYKIYKMSRMIEREIKQSEELQGYACLSCGKEFSVLDAQSLIQDYVFKCDECMGELVENRAKKVAGDPRDLHSSMMNDIKEIVELLKEVDKYDIPSVDYFQVLKMRKVKEEGDGGKSALVKETIEEEKEEELIEDITIELPSTVNIVEEGKNEKKKIDEMVLVSGMQKSFSEVTEEDQEKMSEAEYEKYYEIYSKYNQE